MGARLGVKVADVAEVSLVGRFGQVLTRPEFVVTDGESEDRKLAQLVDTTSASRAFYQAGIRASLFGESRSFHGHHDLGVLRPLVEIELGQRWTTGSRTPSRAPPTWPASETGPSSAATCASRSAA
jgi:hypothetical protein